jgi:ADP-heptose:LPS heptosyltransferase
VFKDIIKRPLLRALVFVGSRLGYLLTRPFDKNRVRKILVFKVGGIGDVLLVFPAIEALHQSFPEASLSVLTEMDDRFFDLFPAPDIISRRYRYEPRSSHRSVIGKLRFFLSLRSERFDLIYNPNCGIGLVETSIMAFLIGAPFRLGFDVNGSGFLNSIRKEFDFHRYRLDENMELLNLVGVGSEKRSLYLHIPDSDLRRVESVIAGLSLFPGKRIVTIHPGAHYHGEHKTWPAGNFAKLISKIIDSHEVCIILVGSPSERGTAETIIRHVEHPWLIDMVGRTSLGELAALIRISRLFIGNDSGPLHMAVAQNVSCIGIFGFTSPEQLLPLDQEHVHFVKASGEPPYLHQPFMPLGRRSGKTVPEVSVQEVFELADKLLRAKSVP